MFIIQSSLLLPSDVLFFLVRLLEWGIWIRFGLFLLVKKEAGAKESLLQPFNGYENRERGEFINT